LGFIAFNKNLSLKLSNLFRHASVDVLAQHSQYMIDCISKSNGKTFVDVGGGRNCAFSDYKGKNKIISVDISEEELKHNNGADVKIVSDVTDSIPVQDADIICSKTVMEHLRDVEKFIENASGSLKKDGLFINAFPCKFAPFAILNQLLPNNLAKAVLRLFFSKDIAGQGFPAFYNKCYYSAFMKLLKNHGFDIQQVDISYSQSNYFHFFTPLAFFILIYECITAKLNVKNLSAYMFVIAKKI
jgi:SAM-dependent methyltransferase